MVDLMYWLYVLEFDRGDAAASRIHGSRSSQKFQKKHKVTDRSEIGDVDSNKERLQVIFERRTALAALL
jgi:hypothetical protein